MERKCKTCKHWISYEILYDDPLEPCDYGLCQFLNDPKRDDEACDKWCDDDDCGGDDES